jgi:membrane protein YqaA with SNARE-associated domain
VLSFVAFSRHALGVLHAQRMIGAVYSILFFAWLPLVPALLARVAGAREQLAPRGAPVPARA